MSEVNITSENFKELVENSSVPVLVDFWAPWCMPCRMLAPILEEFAEENVGRVVVGKFNVDEENDLAMQFGITSIPCLILFKDGKPARMTVGLQDKKALEDLLD